MEIIEIKQAVDAFIHQTRHNRDLSIDGIYQDFVNQYSKSHPGHGDQDVAQHGDANQGWSLVPFDFSK
jgi:hypothetical protein